MDIITPDNLIRPTVEFDGMDGNAFSIIANVSKALKRAGNGKDVVDSYMAQAMAGDYDHLLAVSVTFTN